MKSRLLIIIGISSVLAISLSYYAIYDSSTTVFISCIPGYEQIDGKCVMSTKSNSYPYLQYSVQELLDDPSLIPIDTVEEKYIHLKSDGEGLKFSCASIGLERLSLDKVKRYTVPNQTSPKFFTVTDDELEVVPQLKPLIAATHQIEIPYNDRVHIYFDGIDFVEYEFFLADKSIEKYGGTREDYFMKLDSDYEERLTNPKKQGFTNEFLAPQIIYNEKVYAIGGTVFWTSDEHNLHMSVNLMDAIDDKQKSILLFDKDMKKIPKIKDAINGIGKVQEYVVVFKGVPEPEQNEYNDWYMGKAMDNFGDDEESMEAFSGFTYNDEYYEMNFPIC